VRWAFWKRGPSPLALLNERVTIALDGLGEIYERENLMRRRPRKWPCGAFLIQAVPPKEERDGDEKSRQRYSPSSIISSRCFFLAPGEVHRDQFMPQTPVPAGSWIVAWGPCNVLAVQVGTNAQDMFPESLGPATVLSDSAHVGSLIGFTLQAWEVPPP